MSRIHKKTLLYNKRGGIVIYTPNSDCRSKEFNLGRDTKTNTLTLYVKHSFDEAPGFVYMCPTWEGYQAKLEHLVRKLADYHHDFISMDIGPLGQPRSCHNSSHDHLRGLGKWYVNANIELIKCLQAAVFERQPQAVFGDESMAGLLPFRRQQPDQ